MPSLPRTKYFSQPLYLQQLDTVAMFSTIQSNSSNPPTDGAFNALLACSAAFTNAMSNSYRFAVPAEMLSNQPTADIAFDYTQLLFYQSTSSSVSSFFSSPSNVDITQGTIIGSSPLNTVTEDYIKQLALCFFGDRKADVMFTNAGTATTALSSLVAGQLSAALVDSKIYSNSDASFDTQANLALQIFKAIVFSDSGCFASLTPANAMRTFTYNGNTYYEYGLPIMTGDSFVIHLQIQPNSSQMVGQAWEPVTSGTPPTVDYSVKLTCS
jgi:hypothetical protein